MTVSYPLFCTHIYLRRRIFPLLFLFALCLFLLSIGLSSLAQTSGVQSAQIRYDSTTCTFRIDAANVSYVFGVNKRGELQALYWGKRLRQGDPFPAPVLAPT